MSTNIVVPSHERRKPGNDGAPGCMSSEPGGTFYLRRYQYFSSKKYGGIERRMSRANIATAGTGE